MLTQRKGASLTLQSGTLQTAQNELPRVGLTLAEGSLVAVDPGQRINVAGIGQITLNGTLQAWSGRIAVTARDTTMDETMATGSGRSLWVGEHAVLDVRAPLRSTSRASPTVCCRMAAASRWAAWSTSPRATWPRGPVHRAAAGQPAGRIRRLRQPAGQRRAGVRRQRRRADRHQLGQRPVSGRTDDRAFGRRRRGRRRLALGLDTPEYKSSAIQDRVKAPRDFVLSDKATAGLPAALDNPATAADKLAYGHATLGADQLEQGGFGALDLLSNGLLSFAGDVTLNLGQSLRLFSRTLAMTPDAAPTARAAGRALHHAGRRHRRQQPRATSGRRRQSPAIASVHPRCAPKPA